MAAKFYNSGSKGPVEIAKMDFSHLRNSYARLLNAEDGPDRQDELDGMHEEIERREAVFAQRRETLTGEGVTVGLAHAGVGFEAFQGIDAIVDTRAKTEEGAWAKAWQALHGDG